MEAFGSALQDHNIVASLLAKWRTFGVLRLTQWIVNLSEHLFRRCVRVFHFCVPQRILFRCSKFFCIAIYRYILAKLYVEIIVVQTQVEMCWPPYNETKMYL